MRSILLSLAGLGLCAFCAPGEPAPAESRQEFGAAPALSIDGEIVDWRTYGSWLVRFRGEGLAPVFVTHFLIAEEARKAGISLAEGELDARVSAEIEQRVTGAFGGDRERWLAELARLDANEASLRLRRSAELLPELLAHRLLAARRTVADEQVEAEFERRHGKDGRTLWLRAIRLRVEIPTPEPGTSQEERLRRAQAVRDALAGRLNGLRTRILAGEDFAELAREFSDDAATRAQGGELGAPFLARRWPQEAVAAVYALEPGATSMPVYGRGHFNLFQLVREERVELDSVAAALRHEIQNRNADAGELEQFYAQLAEQAQVEVRGAMYGTGQDLNEVVLVVNGTEIDRGAFARWMGPLQGQVLAKAFVEDRVAERAAGAADVTVPAEAIQARVDHVIEQSVAAMFQGDRDKWRADLARSGMTEPQLRRRRALKALVDLRCEGVMMKERSVEPDAVRALWEERHGVQGRSLEVRMLLRRVALNPEPGETEAELKRRAAAFRASTIEGMADVRERVLGGEDFGVLAMQLSDDRKSRGQGGRIAPPFQLHRWPEEVQSALLELKPGQLTQVLELTQDVCLFELLSRRDVAFDAVADELRAELLRTPPSGPERSAFLNTLVESTRWKYHAAPVGAR